MNGRLVAAIVMLLVFAAVDLEFGFTELVAPPIAVVGKKQGTTDPLGDLNYIAGDRTKNLEKIGFSAPQVTAAMDLFRVLSAKLHLGGGDTDKVKALLDGVDALSDLQAATCGRSDGPPPRYQALAWLVVPSGAARRPVDLASADELRRDDWTDSLNIAELYKKYELDTGAKPGAARILLAALLSAHEGDLASGKAPWRPSYFGAPWDWSGIQNQTGVEGDLVTYVVTWHIVMEAARDPARGICSTAG